VRAESAVIAGDVLASALRSVGRDGLNFLAPGKKLGGRKVLKGNIVLARLEDMEGHRFDFIHSFL
jgi:hypothetical protein